jgi:restriction system protein
VSAKIFAVAIPDYQSVMLPLLQFAGDGQEHLFRDAVDTLANEFGLTKDERIELLPSKTQPVFDNRVGWARTYLVKAGVLESPRRGYFRITDRGTQLLKSVPSRLDTAFLREHYQEFRDFQTAKPDTGTSGTAATPRQSQEGIDIDATPEESLENAYQNLRRAVESDILGRLQNCSPTFFERVVVQLLVAMGYGGTLRDAGAAIGRTGDEGIDGIIKEDRLGLDVVYVQAKKWSGTVGRPEIQKFAGALQGQRARKGVFITTSSFSADARAFVAHIESKIVLIDGEQLAQFMFEHNVGVSPASTYDVKKIDADFFEED